MNKSLCPELDPSRVDPFIHNRDDSIVDSKMLSA